MSQFEIRAESLVALHNALESCRLKPDGEPASTFRLNDLPGHLARIIRHPRNRCISYDRLEYGLAFQGLSYTDESWMNLSSSYGDIPVFDAPLEQCLKAEFGDALPVAFSGLEDMFVAASTCTLPYAGEFSRLYPAFRGLAGEFSYRGRSSSVSQLKPIADQVVRDLALTEEVPYQRPRNRDWLAANVGAHYELQATVGSDEELGLSPGTVPEQGWLGWFTEAAVAMAGKLDAALAPDVPLVIEPEWFPERPPSSPGPQYENVVLLASFFDGRPLNETTEWRPSDAIQRLRRALGHPRFEHVVEPVAKHLAALIADVRAGLLHDEALDCFEVSPGIQPVDALSELLLQLYLPYPPPPLPSLEDLPMGGGELRFRFPGLAEFGEARPDVSEPTLVEDAAAAHEPCRIGLPPLIGEIAELVALLLNSEDVDRAMAHLGTTGTGWRPILEGMVTDLTAHVWAHDEERRG